MNSHSNRLRQLYDTPSPFSVQFVGGTGIQKDALVREIGDYVLARIRMPQDGYTPVKGRDYFDGKGGAPGKNGRTPTREELLGLIQPLIPNVRDGIDGATPRKDDLIELIKPLIEEALMTLPHGSIKPNYDEIVGAVTPIIEQKMRETRKGWFGGGGGGDMVRAGSGVTITTNNIGAKLISASGGVTVETPTGTVNASNTVFTVTARPKYVVADGTTYFEGAGYSYAALQITLDIAPSVTIRAII